MSDVSPEALRAALIEALREAHRAGRGIPPSLELPARAFARAQREAGVAVEKVIIEIKAIVRSETNDREVLYIPRLVGWTVAGYFAGTPGREEA